LRLLNGRWARLKFLGEIAVRHCRCPLPIKFRDQAGNATVKVRDSVAQLTVSNRHFADRKKFDPSPSSIIACHRRSNPLRAKVIRCSPVFSSSSDAVFIRGFHIRMDAGTDCRGEAAIHRFEAASDDHPLDLLQAQLFRP